MRYLLRSLTLIHIPDPGLICYGEHVISILTCSYSMYGGLNGSMGGNRGIETMARKHGTPTTWNNALRGLEKQEVFESNKALMERELSDRQFYDKYKEEGSEMRELKEESKSLESFEQELDEVCKHTRGQSKYNCII